MILEYTLYVYYKLLITSKLEIKVWYYYVEKKLILKNSRVKIDTQLIHTAYTKIVIQD